MAKYYVTHTCGHEEEYQLYGKHTERYRKIEWLSGQECPECRRKAEECCRKAEEEVARKEADELGLPELEGSEKQVKWANVIRANFIQAARETPIILEEKAIPFIATLKKAKDFIDYRDLSILAFLKHFLKAQKEKSASSC